jgi:hypothetical protein
MTGTAIIPIYIVPGLYVRRTGRHGKTDIDMTEPAGEFSSMKPMIKYNRGNV